MRPFTNELRKQIDIRIKNGIDISDLIKGINIKGEDFSRAIIKEFNRVNDDISNCLFFQAIIGQENTITNLSGTRMRNTNFKQAKFLGETWLKGVDAKNSTFTSCYLPYPQYQNADFRGSNFCGVITKLSTGNYKGAKFDINFLREIADTLNLDVTFKEKE